jgi:hypothetical protein
MNHVAMNVECIFLVVGQSFELCFGDGNKMALRSGVGDNRQPPLIEAVQGLPLMRVDLANQPEGNSTNCVCTL